MIYSFTAIGAHNTAKLCEKVLCLFASPIPIDRDKRNEFMDNVVTDEIDAELAKCNLEFYKYEDDLEGLNYQYIHNNKEYFN